MKRALASALAACIYLQPGFCLAQDANRQVIGTWKLESWITRFDGGDAIEPLGPDATGRLVITADGYLMVMINGRNRRPPQNPDDKAALLDSMMSYSGKYVIDNERIITRVDMSWNEIFTGQNQTRFYSFNGDKLVMRTGQIDSAVRPGQKSEGTLIWERER